MAKTLKEAPITTANARSKLPAGVHWKGIDPEVHLGYRKGRRGGVWLVRWRNGIGYRQKPLGTADDAIKEGTIDFNAAVRMARKEVTDARSEAKAAADGPVLTVGIVAGSYVAERNARLSKRSGRQVRSDTAQRLGRYLLGQPARGKQSPIPAAPLASVALHLLKETDLVAWRIGLPEALKETAKHRLTNDLKAALNRAFAANRKRLDAAMPLVIKVGVGVHKTCASSQRGQTESNGRSMPVRPQRDRKFKLLGNKSENRRKAFTSIRESIQPFR